MPLCDLFEIFTAVDRKKKSDETQMFRSDLVESVITIITLNPLHAVE
jgi:hypothetical protein